LEASVAFDGRGDRLQFLGADALAVVLAVFAPLQQVVRALSYRLAAALDMEGLLADVAANHAVNVGHIVEEAGAFLLERR
jgi:hypothetical protein